jgi:diacylglycerol kinase (ATP)
MPVSRVYVILNPTAGRGAAERAWNAVRAVLEASSVEWEMARTTRRGHAVELAEAAARAGWGAVLAMGGDGTVHEAANGLMRASGDGFAVPLGIVPVGSGNDFALLAKVPKDAAAAARAALAGVPRAVDVGRLRVGGDARWFTNGVGIGLDAGVAVEANRNRRLRGMGIYLWALAKVLFRFQPPRMRVTVDDATFEHPMTLVTIANGGRHGGGFWLCPSAAIDDGVFDVCICDALGKAAILRFLPKVIRGTHVGESCVAMHRVRRVRITAHDPVPVHADGEIIAEAARELEAEMVAGGLMVLG